MIIKLFQPPAKNWLLIAQGLNDPSIWDHFVPSHAKDSDRAKFDQAVIEIAGENIKLKLCREMLVIGTSVFEYDFSTVEDDILSHALSVAEYLGIELQLDDYQNYTAA